MRFDWCSFQLLSGDLFTLVLVLVPLMCLLLFAPEMCWQWSGCEGGWNWFGLHRLACFFSMLEWTMLLLPLACTRHPLVEEPRLDVSFFSWNAPLRSCVLLTQLFYGCLVHKLPQQLLPALVDQLAHFPLHQSNLLLKQDSLALHPDCNA